MGLVKCGQQCWGNKDCKNKRSCACRCEELRAYNINIFDACVGACNADPSWENVPSGMDWMCKIDTNVLFGQYQLLGVCGVDPSNTILGQEKEKVDADVEETKSFQKKMIVGFGLLILILVVYLMFN